MYEFLIYFYGVKKIKLQIYGNKNLSGEVQISGCKNSAVAIIPATILCDEEVRLRNVPQIEDCQTLLNILSYIGHEVIITDCEIIIKPNPKTKTNLNTPLVSRLRGSYYFFGVLLAKRNKIKTFYPGGCNLGNRPINYHLDGFSKMNVNIIQKNDQLIMRTKKLLGTTINLDFPSVGATINLMLAGTKARGVTVINNCAKEPEVVDVANFLNSMGAKIEGAGTSTITITGVKKLTKTTYTLMPDRIEAGTYLILGACADGPGLTVTTVNPNHLTSLLEVLEKIGCQMEIEKDKITITKNQELKPIHIEVGPYPAFPTDLQQPLTTLLTQIDGLSSIKETIFNNRFSHISELQKMKAHIILQDNTIIVKGKTLLEPSEVTAYDLRGAASLLIACAITNGESVIDNIDVLLRGYEKPYEKLAKLGINCKII